MRDREYVGKRLTRLPRPSEVDVQDPQRGMPDRGNLVGRLWRHGDFCRLWAGETVEWVTDSISAIGVPTLAYYFFHAGALDMGILYALGYIAYPILGLPAGVCVDRWRRKPVLIWTNIIQVVALASIPLAFLFGVLSLNQLFLVSFVMSATVVFFNIAYTAYLPTLIDRDDLVEGNSKLETSYDGSTVIGPTLAGAVMQVFGIAQSIAADAVGTLVAAIAIFSIRKQEPLPKRRAEPHFLNELREGLRCVAESPPLRTLIVAGSVLNVGNSMFYALFLLFMYDELKISIELATIILSIGAVGFVIGAVTAPTFLKRLGLAGCLVLALLFNGVWRLAIPFVTYGPTLVLVSSFWLLSNIGIPIWNVNQVSFRQALVSDELQGRMNATMRTFGYGAYTAGALLGGILGSVYGIIPTMVYGAVIALIAVPIAQFGPLGKLIDTRRRDNG